MSKIAPSQVEPTQTNSTQTNSSPSERTDIAPLQLKRAEVESIDPEGKKPVGVEVSQARKWFLLAIFSMAQFLDVVMVSSMFIATEQISADLDLTLNSSVWIIAAYSLTFSACLLAAGRLADIYQAKYIFCTGFVGLGIISLATSFWTNNEGFLVFRGLAGIMASLTIPSGVHVIVQVFREGDEQAQAIGLFGLSGALGNVMGLVIAGVLMLANWRWIFRFFAILILPLAVVSWFLIPILPKHHSETDDEPSWKRFDIFGTFLILSCLLLFILSLTNGGVNGWKSANFIVPLVLSAVLLVAFFFWESRLDENHALFPLVTFSYPNVPIIMFASLAAYAWWATTQLQFARYYQEVAHYSPILTAVHILPQGITSLFVGSLLTGAFPKALGYPRELLPGGIILGAVGMTLLIFSDGHKYWPFVFPGFIIGSAGTTVLFLEANVSLIQSSSRHRSGFASALSNIIFQIGGTSAISIQAAITTAINPDLAEWKSSKGGFWFMFSFGIFSALVFVVIFNQKKWLERDRLSSELAEKPLTKEDV